MLKAAKRTLILSRISEGAPKRDRKEMSDAAEQRRSELDYVETAEIYSEQRNRQVASALKPRGVEHAESRTQFATGPPTPRLALSIPEFCEAHGISESFYYKLKNQGKGPREMEVGVRKLITFESAAEWRRAREN